MKPNRLPTCALALVLAPFSAYAAATGDPRLREVLYDPNSVVAVPVKRGVVTLVVLGVDEAITEVGSGLGADCAKAEASWCIAAQPGGRTLFVKPKTTATTANTLAVVTDRRVHSLKFVVLPDNDTRPPVYRLSVKPPTAVAQAPKPVRSTPSLAPLPVVPLPPPAEAIVAQRLQAKPQVVNTRYSLAEGRNSGEILPTLVFDDGRFTYLKFPGNREVPAVFHVLGDDSETLVNTRMEDDLLIVDRVSRRLMLRAGSAVVGLWNDAFDLDGMPPANGTTVRGVQRLLKLQPTVTAANAKGELP